MCLISCFHLILSLHTASNSLKKVSSSFRFISRVLFFTSFFTTWIHVVLLLPMFLFTFLHDSFRAIRAGVFSSRRRRWPSHESLLCLIILLHFSTFVRLYRFSFVSIRGHLMFSAFLKSLQWKLSTLSIIDGVRAHSSLL